MTRAILFFYFIFSLGILLSGCVLMEGVAPKGFAQYDKGETFRAVSPSGVVYRVRKEANKPKADLAFWKEALKNRMIDAGYAFVTEGSIQSQGQEGYLLELAAPFGQLDYSYLIAIYVQDDEIYIAESVGEVSLLKKEREAIVEAMQKVR